MLDQIAKRSKEQKSPDTAPLYQQMVVMRHYRMTPDQFKSLKPIDKKILHYSLVMKNHYEALVYEKQKKEMKDQQHKNEMRHKAMGKMPGLRRR